MLTDLFRQALAQIAAAPTALWPGFTPAQVLYLSYDGQETSLWNAAPAEAGWRAEGDRWVFPGRHPRVTANSTAELANGTWAASVLLDTWPQAPTAAQVAALAVHEAFHVYQRGTGAALWQANDLDLLTYPDGNAAVLTSRAMETTFLRRALQEEGPAWLTEAGRALAWRQARFEQLAPEHVAYERALERLEGLAHYVELRFAGLAPSWTAPDWPAEAVRVRTYTTGAAYALLLDRLGTHWPAAVLAEGAAPAEVLAAQVPPAEWTAADPGVQSWAQAEAARVVTRRAQALQAFEAAGGPRVVIQSSTPLRCQGFDPLNMLIVGEGLVLHRRFLQFAHDGVQGEVFGRACLTLSAGAHPLMSGFAQVVIPGGTDLQVSLDGRLLAGEGLTLRSQQEPVETVEGGFRLKLA